MAVWTSGRTLPAGALPRVTFLIATYNRRDVVLHTLSRVSACMPEGTPYEIVVVDNASTDGTADAIGERFPDVIVLWQTSNRGPCAKNAGLAVARGEFVVFLDDDSFPEPGSVARMIECFAGRPDLGAAIFTVTLPDGRRECSAYPNVCIGCGTGFRRSALQGVGGLPEDFFMAAEEYDLSLRLLDAGWTIENFDDLHVTHLKSPLSRFPARIARLDARNNFMLAMRCLPEPWHWRYAMEWSERYRLMAAANGRRSAFWAGVGEALFRSPLARRRPISSATFEQFARIGATCERMHELTTRMRLRRILFVDLGKNILAYWLAAQACGIDVVAIADTRLGGKSLKYRGLPILSDQQAARIPFDAAVISNLSAIHAQERAAYWMRTDPRPVIDLFHPAPISAAPSLAA